MSIKILHLTPAPAGLRAHFLNEDGRTTFAAPVLCLALVEEAFGAEKDRFVDYVVGTGEETQLASELGGFLTVEFPNEG